MQRRAKLGRPTLYNWDKLIEESMEGGKEHDFVEGKEFTSTPMSFGMLVRRTARVRGLKADVSVDGDHVYFFFRKAA